MAPASSAYQALLNSKKINRGAEKTSFTKNSFLSFGGNKDKQELSFPGDIGPMYFNQISAFSGDPLFQSNNFSPGNSVFDVRLLPADITNKKKLKNLAQIRLPEDEATFFGPDPEINFVPFDPYNDPEKSGTLVAPGKRLKTIPSLKTGKSTQIDIQEFKNTGAIVVTFSTELYNDN